MSNASAPIRRLGEKFRQQAATLGESGNYRLAPGRVFGTDAQSWINLQMHYDTEQARAKLGEALARITK